MKNVVIGLAFLISFLLLSFNKCFSQIFDERRYLYVSVLVDNFSDLVTSYAKENVHVIGLSIDYEVLPYLRAGLFGGYKTLNTIRYNNPENPMLGYAQAGSPLYSYGFQLSYHFAEPLFGNRYSKYDAYVKTKYGWIDVDSNIGFSPEPGVYSNYGIYVGGAVNIIHSLYLFGELGIGTYSYSSFGLRFGF
ncbi:hypothetical protein [Alkalitalea saponilacus]|uniref:Outer membrane protein beta-barrel domain-containing protein n=1 Tax=Alkalitalea saponilacus TaxID=889453 RepID=A0A1T5AXT3_9BACT|nr:hypothetical protein [Alkalitalea saponilacus]ASB48569.1 hypothetical protein CDL62_05155 [Alkalitalea saponilacus]SKB39433.1 hypothetical protein SAMN03080601_00409 [Alkalitalea saponilacus]